jgi:archaellum component FlaC
MARNTRNYPKGDVESLKETIKKLKSQVRNLTKQNTILRSENKTLLEAWSATEGFLSEITEDVKIDEIRSGLKKYLKLSKNYMIYIVGKK